MEPLYYTNAHNDYFKSISKRSKLSKDKEKERKHRSSITSFSLPSSFKEAVANSSASSNVNINTSNSFYSNSASSISSSLNSISSPGAGNNDYAFNSTKSSYKKNVLLASNTSGNYQSHLNSPVKNSGASFKVPPIILVANQDYVARNKNELSVSAKEHLKLISRLGNGQVTVKAIGRLSGTGIVPTAVLSIVDLDNSLERQKYDMKWLNTSDSVYKVSAPQINSYEMSKQHSSSNSLNDASTITSSSTITSNMSHSQSYSANFDGPGMMTPPRSAGYSVSKPTPVGSTPEQNYTYEHKGQYSKESDDTLSSTFDRELHRKESSSTIGSSVSSIHSYGYRKSVMTEHITEYESIELDDNVYNAGELNLENDINYQLDQLENDDDDLTGLDHEVSHESEKNEGLFQVVSVCVSNVYNNKGRYWYKTELTFASGVQRLLRRYYQDFYDLHSKATEYIDSFEEYHHNEKFGMPQIPGPIPRPDPNNPSKALLQRCHDLDNYFKQLVLKLTTDGYINEVFEDWIKPRDGDLDINKNGQINHMDTSIMYERPIEETSNQNEHKLGSPKLCVPEYMGNPMNTSPTRPRSPVMTSSPKVTQQVLNKNLPPIPMGDSLPPPTPNSLRFRKNVAHPTPIGKLKPAIAVSPFNSLNDEEEEEVHEKSNNEIMLEIESELSLKNVSIIKMNDPKGQGSNVGGTNGSYTEMQISGPQIRVKVFYNDGEDIFICKVPVSTALDQLKSKIFTRIKDDFAKRNRKLNTSDIFLFSKDSNGIYSVIKDDMALRGVIRTANGKFSVRVEFD